MSQRLFATILLFGLAANFAYSQNGASAFQPNFKPALEIRRAAGAIQIDGDLNDAGWSGAARVSNFAETRPGDQTKPPVETETLVAYDDAYFYLAFIAHDDPKSIRSSLRDRDQIWADDNVGIILDTYGDAAWAYEIFVNPLGIQGDLRWSPQGEDDGFNIIFDSRGKITDAGYQVEVAIPFSSLRFPDKPAQTWRATFWRNHPRDSRRQYTWSAISRDNPCFPCQFGTLTGIDNVKPGGTFELLPSVIGFQSGQIRDFANPNSGLANSKVDGAASLGLQYAFTPSLTAEATYNPDFSQVESDAAQIDVNAAFALFYPERRPFFQEGSDLFPSWHNVFYTRSINDPVFAAKLTGRMNRTSLAYVGARDEHSPIIIPFEERSAILQTGRSTSNVLRLKRTFWENSYIGGLLTDRRLDGGGSGTVAGIDGILRFSKNYQFEGQASFSRTKEPNNANLTAGIAQRQSHFDRGKHTTAFDGESFGGHAIYASFERDARHWSFDFDYWAASPAFRVDNGFVTSNDNRQFIFWTGYSFYPNSKLLDRFNPSVVMGRFWNYADVRKDNWIRPAINFQFKAQTNVFIGSVFSTERFREKEFPGIRRIEFNVNSNFSDPLTMGFWWAHGRFIARNLADPVLGRGNDFQLWATLKPMQRLIIQPEFAYSELNYPDGAEIFNGYILRTRANYQFTREFFLRLITQYNNFSRGFNVEPLLSYKLNAFTIFYIGSTHQYLDLDSSPNRNDLTQTSRQFFMKFQYLVRI
jgi:hypothetical protein